jgi:hypothetical protein
MKIPNERVTLPEGKVRVAEIHVVGAGARRWLSPGPFVFTVLTPERLLFFTGSFWRCRQAGRRFRIEEAFGFRKARDERHVPGRDAGITQTGFQADAGIGVRRPLLRATRDKR